jgi:Sulfotransferase family
MEPRDWPIVVGGCHRSGTSVVRRVLDAHSRIHCGPEIKFFRDFYGDYPDDPLRGFRFVQTARAVLPDQNLLEIVGKAFVEVHEQAAHHAGKKRWADKAPENVLHTRDWESLLGDRWFLVHVVRNPLDTLASISEAGFPRTFPSALEDRIAFFRRYTEAGLEFASRRPHQYCRVVYEELVSSPQAVVADLMGRIGETFESRQLAWEEIVYQPGLEDPKIEQTDGVHGASVGRWPNLLSPEEAQLVRAQTADLWAEIDPSGRLAAL